MPINEIVEKVADEFAIPSAIPLTPAEVLHLATARYHLEKQMAFLLNRYFSQYRENNDTENHMNTGVGAASSQPPSSAVPPAAGARASSSQPPSSAVPPAAGVGAPTSQPPSSAVPPAAGVIALADIAEEWQKHFLKPLNPAMKYCRFSMDDPHLPREGEWTG